MNSGIFLVRENGDLLEMNQQDYSSEDLLQKFLVKYPNLLAGSELNPDSPRKWLLVSREYAIPSEEQESRWSVDHLFLDQDGIPTLVEVKRGTDTRIRREVVGQMLEYAANAVKYWPVEKIRSQYEENCGHQNVIPEDNYTDLLDNEVDYESYWDLVKENLDTGRIRLLFVADEIPTELQTIIEYLNEQMAKTEVLGISIKQYASGKLKTLVPRVVGQRAAFQRSKTSTYTRRKWDESTYMARLLENRGEKCANIAKSILAWANENCDKIWFGTGAQNASFVAVIWQNKVKHQLFAVYSTGHFEVYFQYFSRKVPFNDLTKRKELLSKLNDIEGIFLGEDCLERRPNIDIVVFQHQENMDKLLNIYKWVIDEIKSVKV